MNEIGLNLSNSSKLIINCLHILHSFAFYVISAIKSYTSCLIILKHLLFSIIM